MSAFIDLTGQKYGRLTAIEVDTTKHKAITYWICECECGKRKSVSTGNLRSGAVLSCGCLQKEKAIQAKTKHGNLHHEGKEPRLYRIWKCIRNRCYGANSQRDCYKNYAGRGISMCEEWDDFTAFEKWALENGYADNLSIDRIDVNGDYEPSNCRWADTKTQANNTRRNVRITYNGETHTFAEWGRIVGIKSSIIRSRIVERGWSVEEALTIIPGTVRHRKAV